MGQQIALPAYFDSSQPGDPVWTRLAARQGIVAFAVFDDGNVLAGVKRALRASGIQAFGQVSTHKCTVEPDVCAALIDDWFKQHADLDGIFVDEGPPLDTQHPEQPEPEWVWNYYGDHKGQGVSGYIKRKKSGARVFLHAVGCRDAGVFDVCDVAQIVEQDYALYVTDAWWTGASEPWWTHPPAGKAVAHVVHSCPNDNDWYVRVAIALSKRRGAQYVYVYDRGPGTYDSLPPYWDAELAAVADTPADPCQAIADVIPEISQAIDDLNAEIDNVNGDEKARLQEVAARLKERRAEVNVILKECRQG